MQEIVLMLPKETQSKQLMLDRMCAWETGRKGLLIPEVLLIIQWKQKPGAMGTAQTSQAIKVYQIHHLSRGFHREMGQK